MIIGDGAANSPANLNFDHIPPGQTRRRWFLNTSMRRCDKEKEVFSHV